MQDWYYGKVKAIKGKEPAKEQKGIFPKNFVIMSNECDPIADRMKTSIVGICRGYKNCWLEAKEYDTRWYNVEFTEHTGINVVFQCGKRKEQGPNGV